MTVADATHFEVAINNGLLVDGTGAPAYKANLGIRNGTITHISTTQLDATHVIDATGLVVAPGFIDLHSHADYTVEGGPSAEGQLFQGVTTLLTGNCGYSPFPINDLAELKQWSGFLGSGVTWNWTDLEGFAKSVNASQPAINIAPQLGHVSVRVAAMGSDNREPTATELASMQNIIGQAAEQGVWGFSSGLIYAPGSFAGTAEMNALIETAANAGLLYSTHMRDETSHLIEAVEETIAGVELAKGRGEISHLKAMGPANHGSVAKALDLIDAARARGVDIAADVYPYTASGTTLLSRLPDWALDGGFQALAGRLAVPELRAKVREELEARTGVDLQWEGVVLGQLEDGEFSGFAGHSVAQVAEAIGVAQVEAVLRIIEAHRGMVPIINHSMAPEDVATVLRHPWVSVASDGDELTFDGTGPSHPRSFGTFPRVLGRYVREQGVLEPEEAVRKMTSLPASRLGMTDRGTLKDGMVADIAVFDPTSIAGLATYEDPRQASVGMRHVLVAGTQALRDGVVTGARAGAVLLKSPNAG